MDAELQIPETLHKNPAPISLDLSVVNLMSEDISPTHGFDSLTVKVCSFLEGSVRCLLRGNGGRTTIPPKQGHDEYITIRSPG